MNVTVATARYRPRIYCIVYTLVFSRGHEKRVDVEQMLESYINSRLESRSSQVTRDCVVIVKHVQ